MNEILRWKGGIEKDEGATDGGEREDIDVRIKVTLGHLLYVIPRVEFTRACA